MKTLSFVIGALTALLVTEASAQMVNLTGKYRCVQVCMIRPTKGA